MNSFPESMDSPGIFRSMEIYNYDGKSKSIVLAYIYIYIYIWFIYEHFKTQKLQDELVQEDANANRRFVQAAIITFKTFRDATIASQVLWQAKPYHILVQPAPEPQDIIWKNLDYPLWNR